MFISQPMIPAALMYPALVQLVDEEHLLLC
jgi:hypothetical protein